MELHALVFATDWPVGLSKLTVVGQFICWSASFASWSICLFICSSLGCLSMHHHFPVVADEACEHLRLDQQVSEMGAGRLESKMREEKANRKKLIDDWFSLSPSPSSSSASSFS